MIYFRIARYESDCHGGGYYDDLKLDDYMLDDFEFQVCRVKDIDGSRQYGGRLPSLEAWQKRSNKNYVLHFAGIHEKEGFKGWVERCFTWDEHYFLYICAEAEWEKIYKVCQDYGIHREWELKTFYDGIIYKRVVLDWKGDCD